MNGHDTNLLDAYLDGLLSPDARATFESELVNKPQLRRQVDLQHFVDQALQRLFAVPDAECPGAERLPPSLIAATSRPAPANASRFGIRRALTIAAAIAIAAIAVYRLGAILGPPKHDGRYFRTNQQAMDVIYNEKVAAGFLPEWKCDDEEEFKRSFQHQLLQPLVMMAPPPGLTMGGLGYCNTLSPYSMFMLAHVHDSKVIVFFDRLEADRALPALADAQLHRFRREVGQLVLYEVTPLDQPRFLPLFVVPQVRPGP